MVHRLDLGLTAYSRHDGIHGSPIRSRPARRSAGVAFRLMARNNEVLGQRPTMQGPVLFDAGLARGEGGMAPACSSPPVTRRLRLSRPEASGLRPRRPRRRRADAPAGLDAFMYTERGIYRARRDRACDGAASRRARQPRSGAAAHPSGQAPRRRRIRRSVVPDQGIGGRALDVPIIASAADRHLAGRRFHRPERPPVGEASFLVEDYVPDRLEFDLTPPATSMPGAAARSMSMAASSMARRPRTSASTARSASPSTPEPRELRRLCVRPRREDEVDDRGEVRSPICRPPTMPARQASPSPLHRAAGVDAAVAGEIIVRMRGGQWPRRRAHADAAGPHCPRPYRRQAAFDGDSARRGQYGRFRRVIVAPDGKRDDARRASHGSSSSVECEYQWYRTKATGITSRSCGREASLTARSTSPPAEPARIVGAGDLGSLPPRSDEHRASRSGDHGSTSIPAGMPKPQPTRLTCSRSRSTSRNTNPATP